ncbi:creatininase family protein [Methylocapsa polymorpha]|uniref:Creatininase family protein n=1 Tax=Methylocapsa polymorpha TaxID=3080828 RepID=A0ABZ0HT30_9HYPH|nr:creatininase family protein [Methylocapsa sp. RX1]
MPPTKFWAEMAWTDFQHEDMANVIAVLPVAAVEQHGPHLPLGVDAFIMEGYIGRVVARLPAELPVLFLPVQTCGCSIEHADFPGALSLSAQTTIRAWTELGECVHRAGCRKLVLLNSHGGNSAILSIIAHDLRARLGMFVVMASWSRFGAPDGLFSAEELAHGIHAGDVETSLMLSFRPDLVRIEKSDDFVSASVAMENEFNWLRAGRPTGFGWMSQDLSASGAMGNAAAADARKGEACADYGATAFIELLQDVEGFDLARLKEGPRG